MMDWDVARSTYDLLESSLVPRMESRNLSIAGAQRKT
jgi:hypothetical protein